MTVVLRVMGSLVTDADRDLTGAASPPTGTWSSWPATCSGKGDEYAAALTDAYRDITAELLRRNEQERAALVEALLTGAVASTARCGRSGPS